MRNQNKIIFEFFFLYYNLGWIGVLDIADASYVQLSGSYSTNPIELRQRKPIKCEQRMSPLLLAQDRNRRSNGGTFESVVDKSRREQDNTENMAIRLKSTKLKMTSLSNEDNLNLKNYNNESSTENIFETKTSDMENVSTKVSFY